MLPLNVSRVAEPSREMAVAADVRRTVERAITRAVVAHALWSPGARLVVAVSGGADSLCLLGTLLALRERGHRLAPGELIVAHLDHGLRGEESREDARSVKRLAADLGVPCVIEEANATYSAELRIGLEDWARRTRYTFLRRVAAERPDRDDSAALAARQRTSGPAWHGPATRGDRPPTARRDA
jgi:3'-phosphoadenosine 5'-phosphosulfate sulfotransferase (PAPS reductase)/FAD synthetase